MGAREGRSVITTGDVIEIVASTICQLTEPEEIGLVQSPPLDPLHQQRYTHLLQEAMNDHLITERHRNVIVGVLDEWTRVEELRRNLIVALEGMLSELYS